MALRVAIVGSGVAGRLLARALVERGDRVTVLSPRPVELPALWIACDAPIGKGLRAGLADAELVVFAAAGRKAKDIEQVATVGAEQVCRAALRAEARRLLILGPAGASTRSRARHLQAHAYGVDACARRFTGLEVLQLPPLFGEDDHLLSRSLALARQGKPIPARNAALELRPLWVGDAKRLLLAAVEKKLPARACVQGPSRVTLGDLQRLICEVHGVKRSRLGGRAPGSAGRPTADELACLKEQLEAPDGWGELGLGDRITPTRWIRGN